MNVAELIKETDKLTAAERAEFVSAWREHRQVELQQEMIAFAGELLKGAEDFKAGRVYRGDDRFWDELRSEVASEVRTRKAQSANGHA